MILARYCSKTVLQEQLEKIRCSGSILWPPNFLRFVSAWSSFRRVELKLSLFEYYIWLRRLAGLPPMSSI